MKQVPGEYSPERVLTRCQKFRGFDLGGGTFADQLGPKDPECIAVRRTAPAPKIVKLAACRGAPRRARVLCYRVLRFWIWERQGSAERMDYLCGWMAYWRSECEWVAWRSRGTAGRIGIRCCAFS